MHFYLYLYSMNDRPYLLGFDYNYSLCDYLFEYHIICSFWLTDVIEIGVLINHTHLCDSHTSSVHSKEESGQCMLFIRHSLWLSIVLHILNFLPSGLLTCFCRVRFEECRINCAVTHILTCFNTVLIFINRLKYIWHGWFSTCRDNIKLS